MKRFKFTQNSHENSLHLFVEDETKKSHSTYTKKNIVHHAHACRKCLVSPGAKRRLYVHVALCYIESHSNHSTQHTAVCIYLFMLWKWARQCKRRKSKSKQNWQMHAHTQTENTTKSIEKTQTTGCFSLGMEWIATAWTASVAAKRETVYV